jgi:catechol-2,3-dioxygenase
MMTCFMRGNHEHHNLACFHQDRSGIDHHSYEAGEWDTIRDWADHLATQDIQLMWGPGRHGPGNNLFIFIVDPDGNWIEISAELEVIHDRPVKDWPHGERTLNLWGRAILRAEEV